MRTVQLLQREQNAVGLEVPYDLSLAAGLDGAKACYDWARTPSEQTEFALAYYDSNSLPLLEWMQLVVQFQVILDDEMILASPLPSRLNISSTTLKEVLQRETAATDSSNETDESGRTEKSFSELEAAEDEESGIST